MKKMREPNVGREVAWEHGSPGDPACQKIRDIEYYEGTILAEFRVAATGQHLLFLWNDRDEKCNRWLVFPVTPEQVVAYLVKQVTLRSLIDGAPDGTLRLLDIDGSFVVRRCAAITAAEAGEWPKPDAVHDQDLAPEAVS